MDPGETTLDSISISSQDGFTEPKKKRGRPSNAQKALEKAQKEKDERVFEERYAAFIEEYIEFCEDHPDYALGEPRISKPIDLRAWEKRLESQKKKVRLDISIEALPLNFHYLVDGVSKVGQFAALKLNNPRLALRMIRFKDMLQDPERYGQLEEVLIKLLKKYPRLQTSEMWPEVQLLYLMTTWWAETADEEVEIEFDEENIPGQFADM